MIRLLIKHFIPNCDDVSNSEVRNRYGILGGVLGSCCNLFLFIIKIIAGASIHSIAVISDAFNNLSDLGSSLISAIGSKLSGKRADKGHPYGHGRAEYISALIISFIIIFFGAELFKSSVSGLFNPRELSLGVIPAILMLISIPVKLWMWYFNRYMGKLTNSPVLMAAARDSLNDCIATSAVIVSAFIAPYAPFPVDSAAGLCVSAMIVWTGIGIARDTTNRLMGAAPSDELIQKIEDTVMSGDIILGMHDLMVHDYGPGRTIASVHAEVPAELSLISAHETIDKIEHKILRELGVDIVIHIDPVNNGNNTIL